jgi:hypothetical protein
MLEVEKGRSYIKTQLDDFLAFPARLFGFTDRQHSFRRTSLTERGVGVVEYDMIK